MMMVRTVLKYSSLLMLIQGQDLQSQTNGARISYSTTGSSTLTGKGLSARPAEYTVRPLSGINTEKPEFSPSVKGQKLLFTTGRSSFDFSNYNFKSSDGSAGLDIFISEIEGIQPLRIRPLSRSHSSDFQNGAACLSADGQTVYFTRVATNPSKNGVNQSRIFTGVVAGNKLKDIKPLSLTGPDYSAGHPSISADNNTLYFSSNMPGGSGGKDIWKSERKGTEWSAPVNLGPDVNTTGDEIFPSLSKQGILFYSSNGLPGFGGFDIYSAKFTEGKWLLNRNEGLNLNSDKDELGIAFLNDSTGYFSSNRPGGAGQEDIYLFQYKNRSIELSGIVLLTENLKDYARNKKVMLLDKTGKVLDSTYTDVNGKFRFQFLDADQKYMVSIEETDPVLARKARFFLMQNDSTIGQVSTTLFGQRFVFRNLPADANTLPDLSSEDDLVFAGTLRYGDSSLPLSNSRIKIVNEFGDVVMETHTNKYGSFAFRNIPTDQNYLISIEETEATLAEGTKIVLLNKAGKEVRVYSKSNDKFNFKVLNTDKEFLKDMDVEDVNLIMGVYGIVYDQNKRPIVNARIRVKEEDGSNAREYFTSVIGKFDFKNLDADKNYIFEVEAEDPALKDVTKLYIADSKGRIYKALTLIGGRFTFKMVEADKMMLGEFVAEDPWLRLEDLKSITPAPKGLEEKKTDTSDVPSITIVENIYYAFGDYRLDENAKSILNKAVQALKSNPGLFMEISSHTDSKASDDFNLELSNKRARTAVEYIVKNGIDRSRLKATGYGESRLLNDCSNNAECSEEQHQKNRRTEFKFTKK